MRAGEVIRGLDAARGVLAAVGLPLPRTMVGGIVALLWFRLVLRLRGYRFVPRAGPLPPGELTRIDVCWSVSLTLPYADPLAAGVSHVRHVLLALRSGDPVRAARALAVEASFVASSSFAAWPRAARVLAAAKAAADLSADPYAQAMVLGLTGIASCAAARFEDAIMILKEAVGRFRAQVPGSAFEVTTVHFFLFVAMAYSGRYGELRPRLESALVDARERGDRYAEIMLRVGTVNRSWLLAGEPARARREVAEARRALPNDRFRAVHYQALVAESYVDVYEGQYERAYDLIHAALPAVRRSFILQLQGYRTELAALRGRVAIACAMTATGRRRAKLIREAMRLLPDIGATPGALGRVNTRVVRLNAAMIRGRRERLWPSSTRWRTTTASMRGSRATARVSSSGGSATTGRSRSWPSRRSPRAEAPPTWASSGSTSRRSRPNSRRTSTSAGPAVLFGDFVPHEFTGRSSPSPASSRGSAGPSSSPAPSRGTPPCRRRPCSP